MSNKGEISSIAVEDGVGVLTIDSPPVNALGVAVRRALDEGIREMVQDTSVDAIILLCGGRTFFAGADISEFGKAPQVPLLPAVLEKIENCPKPLIAAMHGTALGGGYELALTCHYRIAAPSAKVGLPEVKLGLLPGAGGTQRLPRLVGPAMALDLIVKGDQVPAVQALQLGMIDAIAREGQLREDAIAYARAILAEGVPLRRIRDRNEKIAPDSFPADLFDTFRAANAASMRGFKAPGHIVQAIGASVRVPFDDGLLRERALFQELRASRESAAQRYYFFAEREAAKIAGNQKVSGPVPITSVGIVGGTAMGIDIAMAAADAGLAVTVIDIDTAAGGRARRSIADAYAAAVHDGRMTAEEVARLQDRIALADDPALLSASDLIVEFDEDPAEKQRIIRRLDAIVRTDTILATSGNTIDVEGMAVSCSRPERVVGMHFCASADAPRLVEAARCAVTSPEAIASAMHFVRRIGRVAVLTGPRRGFIANRIMSAMATQARAAIAEGSPPGLLEALLYDYGFPADHIQQISGTAFGDFDQYSTATDRTRQAPVDDEELLERLLLPVVNEGAKLLEEKGATRASDIDVVAILGYGWPVYRGGPMFWADEIGLPRVLSTLNELRARHGEAFRPSALLEEKVALGASFTRG
ncbi:enoyl-CoA hydratase-related protein [Sphingosinicella microcystinivorans]|uniref:enoyl-CoA hydratase-related protein n=1 Tax=Sphingosinicella microcystinivorans TaxID=335406 RepID=UPI0022F3E762|nr:enoyl-CoA hydratase-related protein [Sphingosinicella microcystinivorans]WBX83770.1 enoyl-CoA hydratase-related protein [Sphingosinicella microcystinivorans]